MAKMSQCSKCKKEVSELVETYSKAEFNDIFCFNCQIELRSAAEKIKQTKPIKDDNTRSMQIFKSQCLNIAKDFVIAKGLNIDNQNTIIELYAIAQELYDYGKKEKFTQTI